MAGYREHISVSGLLGVGYGCLAALGLGFSPVQGMLAGVFTGIGGMLPDLDSQSGKPVRELFSLTAAITPVIMMRRLLDWGGDPEGAMLLAIIVYIIVRYGGSRLLNSVSVHRGMFHSLPAMLIAAELIFLGYKNESLSVKFLMAAGVSLGFLSHLILDELYSVEFSGVRLRLNKAAGSAFKMFSKSVGANAITYGLLATLTYITLIDMGWIREPDAMPNRPLFRQAAEQPEFPR